MQVQQIRIQSWDAPENSVISQMQPQLALVFADVQHLSDENAYARLKALVGNAELVGCSTAGEITAQGVHEKSIVITGIRFDKTRMQTAHAAVPDMVDSEVAGQSLGKQLLADDLKAVLVFGKGVAINGSALISGLRAVLPEKVLITGGLAGDGGAFVRTLVVSNGGIHSDSVVAVGLYGEDLVFSHGSFGGWTAFGPARKVTRCEGNILFELDGQPALELYKEYLGEYARELPASGLLFPFEMLDSTHASVGLIRTILGVDEAKGSLILAGDIQPDGFLRLMHASNENLVDGAESAAQNIRAQWTEMPSSGLGILVSCVGRKLVMGDAIDDEVEAVASVLGAQLPLAGFYSYGEIAPFSNQVDCHLHNQTMTVTFLSET